MGIKKTYESRCPFCRKDRHHSWKVLDSRFGVIECPYSHQIITEDELFYSDPANTFTLRFELSKRFIFPYLLFCCLINYLIYHLCCLDMSYFPAFAIATTISCTLAVLPKWK